MRALLAAVGAVSLATAPAAHAGGPSCKGSLSGAVRGKFECVVDVSRSEEGKLFFVITPKNAIPGVPSYAPGAFELAAPPEPGTYTLATLGVGRASVAADGGALYTATKTSSQRGEVTLSLRSVRAGKAPGAYVVRGTYTARLVPAGAGKEGTVVVDVKF